MRVGVVVFPGSNCDRDSAWAVQGVLGQEAVYLWHKETDLQGVDMIFLPGGFSYGDYLRTGAFARLSPIMSSVIDFAESGGLVLGVCNGFQVLLECGLLPGAMIPNRHLRFICREITVRCERDDTPFSNSLRVGDVLRIPIAHFEGNYFADEATIAEIEDNNQVLFRYCDSTGDVTPESNPNGSSNNIAGLLNCGGNVLGMMPHPERACEDILGSEDGLGVFESVLKYLEGKAALV